MVLQTHKFCESAVKNHTTERFFLVKPPKIPFLTRFVFAYIM